MRLIQRILFYSLLISGFSLFFPGSIQIHSHGEEGLHSHFSSGPAQPIYQFHAIGQLQRQFLEQYVHNQVSISYPAIILALLTLIPASLLALRKNIRSALIP